MAVIVVGIELVTFWFIDSVLSWHYLIATWLSLLLGILLNWVGSRYFVFGNSKHTKKKEFSLVFATSMVGVVLQSGVVTFMVEIIHGPALSGKVAAIVVTFFWNYFIRKHYIYNKDHKKKSELLSPERIKVLKLVAIYLGLVALATAILIWRYPNNVTHPNFYAEDGSVFLQNILNKGWVAGSTTPFNGYSVIGIYILCALGWVINLVVGGMGLITLSTAFALAAIVFLATVICLPYILFSNTFGKLKILMVVLVSTLMPLPTSPQTVIGTIGNQKWTFLYLAFLFALYRVIHYKKIRLYRLIIIDIVLLICAYTNSAVYLLMPILALPYLLEYRTKPKKQGIIDFFKKQLRYKSALSLIGLGVLLLPQVVFVAFHGIPKLPGYLDTPFRPDRAIEIFINRTYLFGVTHVINNSMNDIIVVLLFIIILFLGWKLLKRNEKVTFFFAIYTAGIASVLFVANRPGVSDFFFAYRASGSGPDQFFFTQTLIMYLPLVLVGMAVIEKIRLRSLRILGISLMLGYFVVAGLISNSYLGAGWRNASVYENDAGIFTDTALRACNTKSVNDISVTVYPYANGRFSLTTPRSSVCNSSLEKFQLSVKDIGLRVDNNNHLPINADRQFTQTFVSSENRLDGVRLFLSTFGKHYRTGEYKLIVMDKSCQTILRQAIIPSKLMDNAYYNARFDPIDDSMNKTYCFSLNTPQGNYDKVAIQLSKPDTYIEGQYTNANQSLPVDVVFMPLFQQAKN